MLAYVCVCVCVCLFVYVCVRAWVHLCVCVYICVYVTAALHDPSSGIAVSVIGERADASRTVHAGD